MLNTTLSQCPYGNWEKTARSACSPSERFHCLNDEFERVGWLCTDPIWIEKGRCPVYNSGARKLDSISCNGDICPSENYRSNLVYIKNSCRVQLNKSEQKNRTNSNVSTGTGDNKTMHTAYYAIIGVTILLLVAVGIMLFFLRRRGQFHRKLRKSVHDEEEEEDVDLSLLMDTSYDTHIRAQSCLDSRKFVVLRGIQGSGKTYLAKKLAQNLNQISKTKCSVTWIHDVLENEMLSLINKGLIVLDDVFYELQSRDEIQTTIEIVKKLFDKVFLSKSIHAIVTIPSFVWKKHSDLFKDNMCFKYYVDLDILSKEEKTEILNDTLSRSAIKEEGNETEKDKLIMSNQVKSTIIDFEGYDYIGYPSCVAWICKMQDQSDLDDADIFLKTPITTIRSEIFRLRDSKYFKERKMFLLLAFMACSGGKLNIKELDEDLLMSLARIFFPKDDCCEFALLENDESLFSLQEKYVKRESFGFYDFYMDVVRKIVFVVALKERNIKDISGHISQDMWKKHIVEGEKKLPTDLVGEHSKMFMKL